MLACCTLSLDTDGFNYTLKGLHETELISQMLQHAYSVETLNDC